jgi:hypothetical protein
MIQFIVVLVFLIVAFQLGRDFGRDEERFENIKKNWKK